MRTDAFTRGLLIAQRLYEGLPVDTPWIRSRFGVSKATAKRDVRKIRQLRTATNRGTPKGGYRFTARESRWMVPA